MWVKKIERFRVWARQPRLFLPFAAMGAIAVMVLIVVALYSRHSDGPVGLAPAEQDQAIWNASQSEDLSPSPGGKLVAVFDSDHILIERSRDRSVVKTLLLYTGRPSRVVWSHDGRYLATYAEGGFGRAWRQLMVWRTDRWRPVSLYQKTGRVTSLQFLPSTPEMIVATDDVRVFRWNFRTQRISSCYPSPREDRKSASVSSDGHFVHFESYDGNRIAWDTKTCRPARSETASHSVIQGRPLPRYPTMTSIRAPAEVVGSWRLISSAPEDSAHIAWDTTVEYAPGSAEYDWRGANGAMKEAIVRRFAGVRAPEADLVVITRRVGHSEAHRYRIPDRIKFSGSTLWCEFSPTGRYLAFSLRFKDDAASEPVDLMLLDLQTSRLSPNIAPNTYDHRLAWSPDGRYLALYHGGFQETKYGTMLTLLCWDLKRSTITPVLTYWDIDAKWLANGQLEASPKSGCVSRYAPQQARIYLDSLSSNVSSRY